MAIQSQAEPLALQPSSLESVTLAEVGLRYLDHCRDYYRTPDGKLTSSVAGVEMALRALFPYAGQPAAGIGAKALKRVQAALVAEGRTRATVNRVVKTVRRLFRWAVSEELDSGPRFWIASLPLAC